MQYTHGGDLLTAQSRYRGEIADFSANINPLGMPEAVGMAAAEAARGAVHYPDPHCRLLRAGIARRDGVEEGEVICGNGAADLIFRLCLALGPKKALVTAPTFSEYQQALETVGCEVVYHHLRPGEDFALTRRVLEDLDETVDLAFLCTPNNPTGSPIDPELMGEILDHCKEKHIRLVVDECFLELSDVADTGGLATRIKSHPNLFLLRAFTKSYALPGLRLGYGLCTDGNLMEKLAHCAQPWSVSSPAQAAGLAALDELEHPARARALIRDQRARLKAGLEALDLTVWPGAANYLLFQAPGVVDLKETLLHTGVLIRACANYVGLGPDYYRVAVRGAAENDRLLRGLREVL